MPDYDTGYKISQKGRLEKYQEGIKNNKIIPTTKTFSILLDLSKALTLKA